MRKYFNHINRKGNDIMFNSLFSQLTWYEGIIILLIFLSICITYHAIYQYIRFRANYYQAKIQTIHKSRGSELSERIQVTTDLLNYINFLAKLYVTNRLQTLKAINKEYIIRNIDDDIRTISNDIFQTIPKNVYTNNYLAITTDYLFEFTRDQVTIHLINLTREHNISLKINK